MVKNARASMDDVFYPVAPSHQNSMAKKEKEEDPISLVKVRKEKRGGMVIRRS